MFVCLLPDPAFASGFLHASGVTTMDINNQPIVLRGVNLGSWLWPEYYMMGNPNLSGLYRNAGTGSGGIANYYDGFVAAVQDLMGGDTNLTAQVLDTYWSNYITAADIAYLHSQGFNSVRVPFDFEEFFHVTNWANNYPSNGYDTDVGFKYFDNLLGWCASNNIYVIPDFHCPPGGPNNFSVTNYGGGLNTNTASVFASPSNLQLAGHIWSRIAARYATNQWVGGYDLLNEPVNTSFGGQVGSPALSNTYSNLVKAVRLVDTNHMIICEGDYYASTLWDVNTTGWTDPNSNLAYSDHDYGSGLPLGTGNRATSVAANVPDWAGEFGINSTRWYNRIIGTTYEHPTTLTSGGRTATIIQGHCFWAYKSSQYYTVVQNPQTPGWNTLKAYWASGNTLPKPSVMNAYNWLVGYAVAANFSNCITHPEIVDALMRPNTTPNSTGFAQVGIPYVNGTTIPGKIFAVDYDMGDSNISYADTVSEDQANHGPGGTAWNNGFFGRDDGVDTTASTDPGTLLKVGWNDAGEWQRHTATSTPGVYDLYIRYAGGATGGQIRISSLLLNSTNNTVVLSSNNLTGTVTLPTTGSYGTYSTFRVSNVVVTNSGPAVLQVDVVTPGYDLVWIEFVPAGGAPLPPIGESLPGTQPGIPAGLTAGLAAAAGNGEVSLNWVPSESTASYNIKRATLSGGPYNTVGSATALSWVDAGLTNGTTYYYVVSASNAGGESADSAEVSATPQPASLPSPWMDQDVGVAVQWSGDAGDVGWPGSASFTAGSYKVSGSGIDIWNNADSFHFAYRAISGDCTNYARVTALQNTDPWAKAGIMIRESLNQDSINVFAGITSQNGATFSSRPATGGTCTSFSQSGAAAPYWVKLVRIGNTFTGYSSATGSTWTQIGSPMVVSMDQDVLVGLAVTAHNQTQLNAAMFDNVTVVHPMPAAPSGLNATADLSQVVLNWSSAPGANSYNVMRSTTDGGPYTAIATGITNTSYPDTAIANGATYYYVVTTVNPNGESPDSNQTTALVPLPGLGFNYTGNNFTLSWPVSTTSFSLYTTTNLASPAVWLPITSNIVNQSGIFTISLPIDNGNNFFRLATP